jgi:predicted permease
MRTLAHDLKFAGRLFRGSPGFTAVAVVTLALGIGAATTVFSWIDGLLLRPFPGSSDGNRLAILERVETNAPNGATQISWLDCQDYAASLTGVSGVAVHREDVFNLGDEGKPEGVWGELVSGNYFDVLGVRPALGRLFSAEESDARLGAHPVVVISYRLWQRRFRGDPAVIGKNVRVNRREMTIVGVAGRQFRGTMPGLAFDMWVPVTMGVELGMVDASMFTYRGHRNLYALVRLKNGVSVEEADAEAVVAARRLAAIYPKTNRTTGANIVPAWRFRSAAPELLLGPLQILMAIATVMLLIVCANVTNLLLARSVSRARELGVRIALGAGRARLVRQMLTETLLLAAGGAAVGIPLSFWMADSLPMLVPSIGVPVAVGFQLNARVLVFAIALCACAAMASGVAPALFSTRTALAERLKEGGRGGISGLQSHRLRNLLVVSEVALAVVCLITAGLFVRSFENTLAIDPGFDRANVVLGRFFAPTTGYSPEQLKRFCTTLRDRLAADPGVLAASYSDFAPLGSSSGPYTSVQIEGYTAPAEQLPTVNRALVSPGYFVTMGIPLVEGRDFNDGDDENAPPVLIVNETFARRFFPGSAALGRKVRLYRQWATIVGVAKDSKYFSVTEPPVPYFYAPFRQQASARIQFFFELRTAGDPRPAMAALRREIAITDPNAGAFFPMALADWTEVTLLPQKVAASLVAALGLMSLLLAAIGLYSVMAYAVSQRTQEIGVRMALGARPRDVLGDVLRRGVLLTVIGLGAGTLIALALTRVIGSMLVNVGAADPATFGGAALFLMVVALIAAYVPAYRATQVDPMHALRCE